MPKCATCPKSAARGRTKCRACLKAVEDFQAAHVAAGLCRVCAEPLVPGHKHCAGHLAYFREEAARRRREKPETLCFQGGCGEPRAAGKRFCTPHAEQNRTYQREYKRKRRAAARLAKQAEQPTGETP